MDFYNKCFKCGKKFKLINVNENFDENEELFICDKCADEHGIPEGRAYCLG